MKVKEKFGISKVLAMLLAVLLLCSMIPIGTLMSVFAVSIGEFTVTLKNDSQTVQSNDANVTLTLKTDAETTKTVKAVSGVATFENFVEDETEYYVSVSNAIGYEDVENFDLTVGQGATSAKIELTALEKITISGKVLNEKGNAYSNATVTYEGYISGSKKTDSQGKYSFEAYKGKDYTVTASGADKYKPETTNITNPTGNYECNFNLTIKEFSITTSSDENGTITDTSWVSYDGSKDIKATANQGYCIKEFKVNGEVDTNATGEKEYTKKFSNVKDNQTVVVTFERQTYTITFTVSQNGNVTYNDGEQTVAGGSVNVEKVFEESTEKENPNKITVIANPSENYRVSKVIVDKNTEEYKDNKYCYDAQEKYSKELEINKNHTIEVEFKPILIDVSVSSNQYGLVYFGEVGKETTKVDYNGSTTLTMEPSDGYIVSDVVVNGVSKYSEIVENDIYTLSISGIVVTTNIEVTFEEAKTADPGNKISNEYYDITFSKEEVKSAYYEGQTYVVVLPKDAYATITCNQNYKGVKYNTNKAQHYYDKSKKINSTTLIENIWIKNGDLPKDKINIKNVNVKIIIDKTAPSLDDIPEVKWNNTAVTVSGTAKDTNTPDNPSSGLKAIVWKAGGTLSEEEVLAEETNKVSVSSTGSYSFKSTDEKQNKTYYVYAIDYANNVSKYKTVQIKIDKTKPQIDGFIIKKPSHFDKVLNFLTFGIFGNSKAVIEVSASDPTAEGGETVPSSGIAKITLFYGDIEITKESKDFESGKAIFEINASFADDIYAQAEDFAGNKSDKIKSEKSNTNDKDEKEVSVKLETDKPTIANVEITAQNKSSDWVDGNFTIKVTAYDNGSGIGQIIVKTNEKTGFEKTIINKDYSKEDKIQGNSELSPVKISSDVNIEEVLCGADGKYVISTTVIDNAGNDQSEQAIVYLDNKAPYIKADGYTFNGTGISESSAVATDYGYYFKDETTVGIKATDESPSSGIDTISVFLKDINGNYVKVNNGIANVIKTTEVDATSVIKVVDDAISFKIPANFKGQIFAKATDNVKNTPESYETPNGAIVENADKHSNTSSIEITPKTSKVGVQDKKYIYKYDKTGCKPDKNMSFSDTTDVPLYNDSADLNVVVNDSYSGIRKIEYTIIENGKETTKAVEYDNAGNAISGSDSGWAATKENGSNLVVTSKKTITVDGNHNNMVLRVILTDRAGNQSYDYYVIGIDKDAPVITVKMNDDDNKDYAGFFNVNRTATFEIKERNFNNKTEDDKGAVFTVTITDENGKKEDVNITPNFTLKPNSYVVTDAEEYSIYTMDYTFDKDGDYTFALQVTDLATNKTEDKDVSYENEKGDDIRDISNKFTVDKTKPVVTVTYDNNNVLNGNYYKADRTATITIAEHNFEAKDVKIIGKATDNATGTETATTFPKESEWKNNGNNTYTATIHYANDSKYTFDIEYLDMAGNSIDDYKEETFFVDKTAPTLEISGVADRSANNGTVAPEIKLFDTNFNKDAITIALTGVNRGGVDYSRSISDIINGQNIRYADFERVQMVDDIYTLSVKLIDMAGNETTKAITFSVNRFGSVYDISGLKDLIGKYLQKEKDVVFTETNVDTLNPESIKIKLTANGTPKDLVLDKDYTIAKVEEKWASWSRYTYTIKKDLFKNDGTYSLSVYSVDAAGNVNENIEESKKAEISFGVDKTKPVIVPIDFEDGKQYPVESKEVTIEIKDNLKLNGVKIYLNDKEVKYENDGETYKFSIPESNSKQSVRIVATDAAGNEHELFVKDFLVSTNIFARWYNNTPLFIGSIIGVVVIAIGIIALILFRKKKQDEK